MSDGTKIEWTEATWNPITGCSVTSPGCANCYAMKLAGTRLRDHPSRGGLTRASKAGPVWTGEVRFNEQWLDQPLRWKRSRMIFVCAHGDLFHESVPDEWIDRVFAVMALAPQHTFQVLTKRSARMRQYLTDPRTPERIATVILWCSESWNVKSSQRLDALGNRSHEDDPSFVPTPLPNVWLGLSVEDQARADERIPDLLATPAAIRWLSCEPLLGPVNLISVDAGRHNTLPIDLNALNGEATIGAVEGCGGYSAPAQHLDWIVTGGESGPGSRPMHPDWARSLRDQCVAAGVPFFFKQWGDWLLATEHDPTSDAMTSVLALGEEVVAFDGAIGAKLGKKRAGRLLDGLLHDAMPEAAR